MMNVSTLVVLIVMAVLVALAVRRLKKRGMCDCKGDAEDGSCSGGCAGCSGCAAAERMAQSMNAVHTEER